MRFHTCYSIDVGPRIHEMALQDIVDIMLQINAGAYSFEAANPRHEHEYHVFEQVKLPEGKVLIPGVISHTTNLVEHPELIAERIVRFADSLGVRTLSLAPIAGLPPPLCGLTIPIPVSPGSSLPLWRKGPASPPDNSGKARCDVYLETYGHVRAMHEEGGHEAQQACKAATYRARGSGTLFLCPRQSQTRLCSFLLKVLLTTGIAPAWLTASFLMSRPC